MSTRPRPVREFVPSAHRERITIELDGLDFWNVTGAAERRGMTVPAFLTMLAQLRPEQLNAALGTTALEGAVGKFMARGWTASRIAAELNIPVTKARSLVSKLAFRAASDVYDRQTTTTERTTTDGE